MYINLNLKTNFFISRTVFFVCLVKWKSVRCSISRYLNIYMKNNVFPPFHMSVSCYVSTASSMFIYIRWYHVWQMVIFPVIFLIFCCVLLTYMYIAGWSYRRLSRRKLKWIGNWHLRVSTPQHGCVVYYVLFSTGV